MTDQETSDSKANESDSVESPSEQSPRPRAQSGAMLWFISPLALIVIVALALAGWLSYSGIDMAWALGTSGWAVPPGAKLAAEDIGGESLDRITARLDRLSDRFYGLSVWLIEDAVAPSTADAKSAVTPLTDMIALSVAPADLGLSVDVESVHRELESMIDASRPLWAIERRIELWNDPPQIPLRLSFDEDVAEDFLYGVKSTYDCEPIDAVMDLANRMVRPSRDGITIDIESTMGNIPTELTALGDFPIRLTANRTAPRVTSDDFDGFDLENPLATYTTRFATWKRNRSRNIEMVASRFEAVVIQPGEVFSFNATTGPRTSEEGYLLAPMYVRSRIEMSPAGGACQVSTTLYNAALLAGLEIAERAPHSRPCSYVPYGRDATVAYGAVDLKFSNTLDHPIIIHQEVDRLSAGTITFVIYGHPDDRVRVEIGNAYSWIPRTQSMTTYILDTSLAPGQEVVEDEGVSGVYQRAWRTWFDEAGNETRTEQLSSDRIAPVGALIRYNPAPGESRDERASQQFPPEQIPSEKPSPDQPEPEEPPPGVF